MTKEKGLLSLVKIARATFLPLRDLEAFPGNPRRTLEAQRLEQMVASIREHGILVPLRIREFREADEEAVSTRYQIVCGQCRANAARLAGIKEVPCIVSEMTEAEAHEIALIDNLQRTDLSALEEAQSYAELMSRLGDSVAAVAQRVGKDLAYVTKRLKLLTLTAHSQRALHEKLISIDHALLLARLGGDDQDAELKWCIDSTAGVNTSVEEVIEQRLERQRAERHEDVDDADDADDADVDGDGDDDGDEDETRVQQPRRPSVWQRKWEPQSVQRLKEHIASSAGVMLDRAAWPMEEDYLLLDVGSCLGCPQNTQANTPLFGDLEMGAAVCTDGACFRAKTSAWVELVVSDAKRAGAPEEPLWVSWRASSRAPKMPKVQTCECTRYAISGKPCVSGSGCRLPVLTQVFAEGQWCEATEKCEHARLAVTVDYRERSYGDAKMRKPGELVQACVDAGCKVHPKAYVQRAAKEENISLRVPPAEESEEQRKQRLKREEALCKVETDIRKRVLWSVLRAIAASGNVAPALRWLAEETWGGAALRKQIKDQMPELQGVFVDAFMLILDILDEQTAADLYDIRGGRGSVEEEREELWNFARAFGQDANAIAAGYFHERGSIAPDEDFLYPNGQKWPEKQGTEAEKRDGSKGNVGAKKAAKSQKNSVAAKAAAKPVKTAKAAPAKRVAASKTPGRRASTASTTRRKGGAK